MQLVRRDANLGSHTQGCPVTKHRRGIHKHDGGVHFPNESTGPASTLRDDDVGVVRPVSVDVLDGLVHVFHHTDRDNHVQVLSAPVLLGSRLSKGYGGPRPRASPDGHAAFLKRIGQRGQFRLELLAHQQRLHCVADLRHKTLGIQDDPDRLLQVGTLAQVDVADAG